MGGRLAHPLFFIRSKMNANIKGMIMIAERFNERLEAIGVSIANDAEIPISTKYPDYQIGVVKNGKHTAFAIGGRIQCNLILKKAARTGNKGAFKLLVTRIKESTIAELNKKVTL